MIICSCNRISDRDVRAAVSQGASRLSQIYAHKSCKADCGGCAKQIHQLLKETKNILHHVTEVSNCQKEACPNYGTCACAATASSAAVRERSRENVHVLSA